MYCYYYKVNSIIVTDWKPQAFRKQQGPIFCLNQNILQSWPRLHADGLQTLLSVPESLPRGRRRLIHTIVSATQISTLLTTITCTVPWKFTMQLRRENKRGRTWRRRCWGRREKQFCFWFTWWGCDNSLHRTVHLCLTGQTRIWPECLGDKGQTMPNSILTDPWKKEKMVFKEPAESTTRTPCFSFLMLDLMLTLYDIK